MFWSKYVYDECMKCMDNDWHMGGLCHVSLYAKMLWVDQSRLPAWVFPQTFWSLLGYSYKSVGSFNRGNGKFIPLIWEFKWKGIEWVGRNTHSSLFPENLKFSFSPKLGGMGGNEIRFNDFFLLKLPKYPRYSTIYFKIGV